MRRLSKTGLRDIFRAWLREHQPRMKDWSERILQQLNAQKHLSPKWGLYHPLDGEPDLTSMVSTSPCAFFQPAILSRAEKRMAYVPWNATVTSPLAETAPEEVFTPDALLIPGLAFDQRGVRLGRGAGYFDRYLAETRKKQPSLLVVGVAFEGQLTTELPREEHDVCVDIICTEERWMLIPRQKESVP